MADRRRIADGDRHRESDPALGIEKCWKRACRGATSTAAPASNPDVNNLLACTDRAIPGLGGRSSRTPPRGRRDQPLGKEAVLEGKKARAFLLRFVDGAVFLGPIKVGQTPPLY
jgi:hypothetical protein